MGPRVTVGDIRGVASCFGAGTACTDGLPVKAVGMLSDGLLGALAGIMRLIEGAGTAPDGFGHLLVALIPKGDGSNRPIVLFRSIMRVMNKVLARRVKRWEAERLGEAPFGNSGHRQTTDHTYRFALRQAVSIVMGTDMHGAVLQLDLAKCFEMVGRKIFWQAAVDLGYPMSVARLSLGLYGEERRIIGAFGAASKPMRAARGIAAGSAYATSELKAVLYGMAMMLQADNQVKRALTIFVDDVACGF